MKRMYAVEVKNLSKFYGKEKHVALNKINLKIRPNQIFGFLGSNGAGKTTFLSILSTTLSAEEGEIQIFGMNINKEKLKVRDIINVCSGYGGLWYDLSVWENMVYYGKMRKIPNYREEANKLLALVGLEDSKKNIVADLSTGMKQRLSLIMALLSKPKVLLLDEPTTGLDPKIAKKVRNEVLKIQKQTNMTILLTTHNMYEAEYMCDNIALIKKGDILAVEPVDKLKDFLGNKQIIELKTEKAIPVSTKIKGVTRIEKKRNITILHATEVEKNLADILKIINKYTIQKIVVRDLSLEELYVEFM